jgi:hypothetical protein
MHMYVPDLHVYYIFQFTWLKMGLTTCEFWFKDAVYVLRNSPRSKMPHIMRQNTYMRQKYARMHVRRYAHMCGFKILQQSPSYNCTNLKPWLFTAFVLTKLTKMLFALISKYFMHTVKSPNNGHFRTVSFVLCKEGVLFGRLKMYQN